MVVCSQTQDAVLGPLSDGKLGVQWDFAVCISGGLVVIGIGGEACLVRILADRSLHVVQQLDIGGGRFAGRVTCAADLSVDHFAVGCDDGTVVLFDASGVRLHTAARAAAGVTCAVKVGHGILLSGYSDGMVRLWGLGHAEQRGWRLVLGATERVHGSLSITHAAPLSETQVVVEYGEEVSVLEHNGIKSLLATTGPPTGWQKVPGAGRGCASTPPALQGASFTCLHHGFLDLKCFGDDAGNMHVVWPVDGAAVCSAAAGIGPLAHVQVLGMFAAPRCSRKLDTIYGMRNAPGAFRAYRAIQKGAEVLIDAFRPTPPSALKMGRRIRKVDHDSSADVVISLSNEETKDADEWRLPGTALVARAAEAVRDGQQLGVWVGFLEPGTAEYPAELEPVPNYHAQQVAPPAQGLPVHTGAGTAAPHENANWNEPAAESSPQAAVASTSGPADRMEGFLELAGRADIINLAQGGDEAAQWAISLAETLAAQSPNAAN